MKTNILKLVGVPISLYLVEPGKNDDGVSFKYDTRVLYIYVSNIVFWCIYVCYSFPVVVY